MTGITDISFMGKQHSHPFYSMRRKGRTLSPNVQRLQKGLITYLNEREQSLFLTILEEYNLKRNVYEFVQNMCMIIDTPAKRQLIPMLRRVIPRADVTMFDHFMRHVKSFKPLKSSGNLYRTQSTLSVPAGHHYGSTQNRHYSPTRGKNQFGYNQLNIVNTKKLMQQARDWDVGPEAEVKRVYIERNSHDFGWGFSIRGGAEHGIGIYISYVDVDSIAERNGLVPGDQILEANSLSFERIAHSDAAELIGNSLELDLKVRNVGRVPGSLETHQTYTWVDALGRSVSPPPEVDRAGRYDTSGERRSGLMLLKDSDERKVNVSLADGEVLGVMLRGGNEFGLGIYITGVDPGSKAEQAGLKVGDQILDVNGTSFLDISHNNSVRALKSSKHLMITVKVVGKLPHSRTTYDDSILDPYVRFPVPSSTKSTPGTSRRHRESVFSRGAGSQLMLNSVAIKHAHWGLLKEKMQQLLNSKEQSKMDYYLAKYQQGHVSVDGLVQSLLDLFNTKAKLTLMLDIRGLITAQDLDAYDSRMIQAGATTSLRRAKSAEAVYEAGSDQSIDSWTSGRVTNSSLTSAKTSGSEDSLERLKSAIQQIDTHSACSDDEADTAYHIPNSYQTDAAKRQSQNHTQQVTVAEVHSTPSTSQQIQSKSPSDDSGVEMNGRISNKSKAPPKPPRQKLYKKQPRQTENSSTTKLGSTTFSNQQGKHNKDSDNQHRGGNCSKTVGFNKHKDHPAETKQQSLDALRGNHSYQSIKEAQMKPLKISIEQHQDVPLEHNHAALPGSSKHMAEATHGHLLQIASSSTSGQPGQSKNVQRTGSSDTGASQNFTPPPNKYMQSMKDQDPLSETGPSKPHREEKAYNSLRQRVKEGRKSINGLLRPESKPVVTTNSLHSHNVLHLQGDLPPGVSKVKEYQTKMMQNNKSDSNISNTMHDLHVSPPPGFTDEWTDEHSTHRSRYSENWKNLERDESNKFTSKQPTSETTGGPSTTVARREIPKPMIPVSHEETGGRLKVTIHKTKPTLGLAIEGGANTRQPLPRIIKIQPNGSAANCRDLKIGHVILEVNGHSLEGLEHNTAARVIAKAFKTAGSSMDLILLEPEAKMSI